jgi:hypothetical protein
MAGTATAALLADAREKYHLLLTGQAVRVAVDQNGERVEYNTANAGKLAEYIRQLEVATGSAAAKARRPLGFIL